MTDLEIQRLRNEGWDEDSIDCYKRFGRRLCLLYSYIDVENGVIAKGKGATLRVVREGEALVQFTGGKPDPKFRKNRQPCVPLTAVKPEDVRPARRMEATG